MKRYKKHKQLLADNCYARTLCQKVLNGWKVRCKAMYGPKASNIQANSSL